MLLDYLQHLLDLYLDTALWLLLGVLLAALIKGKLPTTLVQRWLSGQGVGSVLRAAVIGAPLPLCSCGVLPTAVGLHRQGASKPATVAFLIATPETGVDSISISYALLGPVMAIIRPIAALFSAIFSGVLVLWLDRPPAASPPTPEEHSPPCCASTVPPDPGQSACCNTGTATPPTAPTTYATLYAAGVDILDDISTWLLIGLLLAAAVATVIEPAALTQVGQGLPAMLVMLVVGLPLYICATASTPLAAAMLAAGVSPGAVLVFLLVGPATNISALGILQQTLGLRALALYLLGISFSALLMGLLTDALFNAAQLTRATSVLAHGHVDHSVIHWLAGGLLLVLIIRPLRRLLFR